jgi:hypothetical protein
VKKNEFLLESLYGWNENNEIPFLTTISINIIYRTTEWIPNQTPEAYRSVLENVFRIDSKAGFRVKRLYSSNEF